VVAQSQSGTAKTIIFSTVFCNASMLAAAKRTLVLSPRTGQLDCSRVT